MIKVTTIPNERITKVFEFFNDVFNVDLTNDTFDIIEVPEILSNGTHCYGVCNINKRLIRIVPEGGECTLVHELTHWMQFVHNKSISLNTDAVLNISLEDRYSKESYSNKRVEIDAHITECLYEAWLGKEYDHRWATSVIRTSLTVHNVACVTRFCKNVIKNNHEFAHSLALGLSKRVNILMKVPSIKEAYIKDKKRIYNIEVAITK